TALTLGYGPPGGPRLRAAVGAAYVIIAAAALLRQFEYRSRLWTFCFAAYVIVAVASLAAPGGPYAQAGILVMPILVLALCGARAARIAILTSVIILVSATFLRVHPAVIRTLGIDPAQVADPPRVVWLQVSALVALLAGLMILLDRLHRFLLDTLAALEREAVERSAAQRKMEHEMRERQRLEQEIAAIGDGERRRLGQELHDGVCQQVTAALLRCKALQRCLERGGTVSGTDIAPLSSLLAKTIDEAHNVALGLCPLDPDPQALTPALRALTRQIKEMASVRCEFLAAGDVRVPDPAIAQHLYRIAQEALSNAVRHAHANRITVELRGSEDELTLQVEDDGAGLPPELPAGGMGLRTMAYRAQSIEGKLTVATAPGGGARVVCRVPHSAWAPAAPHGSGD
ncbi:MAG TPA: sensor histidine kinase, partial [Armatimonadota bacterium]